MEAGTEIPGRKPAGVVEFVHELIENQYQKFGLLSQSIQMAKVHTKSVCPVFLLN